MAAQQAISADKLQRKKGQTIEVIIDEVSPDGALGRSMGDAPEIDGLVHLPGARDLKPGDVIQGQVTRSDEYDLWID